ncbi:MAG: hypothetical protein ACOC3W_03580 [Thermodesulfobacteriota bacterium]
MANLETFAQRVLKIEGVEQFIFIRNDGHILIHNVENPQSLSALTAFTGLSGEALRTVIGTTYFKHLSFSRRSKENFLIFPLNNYFLGILQHAEAYTPDVVQRVNRLIQAITRSRTASG